MNTEPGATEAAEQAPIARSPDLESIRAVWPAVVDVVRAGNGCSAL